MILVALDHVVQAVEVYRQVERIVAQRASLAPVVAHAVRFDIGLVDDVEAVFVAQFVEALLLRIVAGAQGIDVVSFPQFKILEHGLFGHVVAGERVVFVHVHPLEQDRLAVDEQLPVFDFDRTEPDPCGNVFAVFAVAVAGRDEQVVEVRRLGGPGLDAVDGGVEVDAV